MASVKRSLCVVSPGTSPFRIRSRRTSTAWPTGTTYTAVGVMSAAGPVVLPAPDGARAVPSVVSFPRDGAPVVGASARDRLASDPSRTIASPKRLLGRRLADREVQSFVATAPYRTATGDDGAPVLEASGLPKSGKSGHF